MKGDRDPNWISRNENDNIWDGKFTKWDYKQLDIAEELKKKT